MAMGFVFTYSSNSEITSNIGSPMTVEVLSTVGLLVGQTVALSKPTGANPGKATILITSIIPGVSFTGTFLGAAGDSAPNVTINQTVVILVADVAFAGCAIDSVLLASACYQNACLSDADTLGLMIYARVKSLAAAGGADYSASIASLEVAAAKWRILNQEQRDQIDLFHSVSTANQNGAAIATGASALRLAASCYTCIPVETQKNLLAYLKCLLSARGLAA